MRITTARTGHHPQRLPAVDSCAREPGTDIADVAIDPAAQHVGGRWRLWVAATPKVGRPGDVYPS